MKMRAVVEDKQFVGRKRFEALTAYAKYEDSLADVERGLKHDPIFTRFNVGRGGSHVWVSLQNGRRVAMVMEVEE